MTYKLRIKDEDGKSTVVPMNRDMITVGRQEGMTIRLTEKNVSREHARISNEDGDIYVEDTSRYGTCINGSRIKGEKKKVEPGDVVLIGDYELSVEGKTKAAAKPKPKPKPKAEAAPAPKPKKSKRQGGPSGDTAMISLDELAKRERAAGRRRVDADVATLFILNTDMKGKELSIRGDDVTIGRESGADIVVNHTSISAVHASLTNDGGKYRIEDLGSSNGMKINGEYYERSVLRRGDIVELGHVRMRFIEPGEVFVYNPDDYEDGAAGDDFDEKKGGGKGLIWLVLLVLVAGGLAAAYFLYFGKDTPLTTDVAAGKKGAATAQKTDDKKPDDKKPDDGAKAEEVKPGVKAGGDDAAKAGDDKGDDAAKAKADAEAKAKLEAQQAAAAKAAAENALQDLLDKGNKLIKKENWDDAIVQFNAAIQKDPASKEAKDGLATARSEKAVAEAYKGLKSAVDSGDLKKAVDIVAKTPPPGEESVYHNRYAGLAKGARTSYIKGQLDAGNKSLRSKQWQEALNAANAVLAVDDKNSKAKKIKGKAAKGIKKDAEERRVAEAKRKKDAKKNDTKKKDDKKKDDKKKDDKKKPPAASGGGDTGAMSAKDLYREGRKLLSSGNKDGALKMFQKAASKGYSKAYKLMGNIYLQKGQTGKAKSMYKKYLRLRPGASDAEAIKATIIRLGG